ncbi:MAG: SRPBCC family protein [Bacteroidetes bacterium]|jgi:uncharacterized protein YndB with AHSA1/START domain|nr:SRPBCC family protein [Bacteroidota bacterium]
MAKSYSFITYWEINAPIEKVWALIYNSTEWANWWRGVVDVSELEKGNENGIDSIRRYTWKSKLPYKLSFDMRLTEFEYCKKLSGTAFGELEGNGTWMFKEKDGVTIVTYYWNIVTNKTWMNSLAFLLKPIFIYNHNVLMRWGKQGLEQKLGIKK